MANFHGANLEGADLDKAKLEDGTANRQADRLRQEHAVGAQAEAGAGRLVAVRRPRPAAGPSATLATAGVVAGCTAPVAAAVGKQLVEGDGRGGGRVGPGLSVSCGTIGHGAQLICDQVPVVLLPTGDGAAYRQAAASVLVGQVTIRARATPRGAVARGRGWCRPRGRGRPMSRPGARRTTAPRDRP